MTDIQNDAAADPQQTIAELQRKLAESSAERDELLRQQIATADVLKVISSSAFELQTVLDTLAESAAQLCEADEGVIYLPSGGRTFHLAAGYGIPENKRAFLRSQTITANSPAAAGLALREGRIVHIEDSLAGTDYRFRDEPDPARTKLGVPLLREGQPIGVFVLVRKEKRAFTEKQIQLVQTFADQAVIAIENARLFNETREALERQTATAEVLQVISSSPGDLKPVFDQMLAKAMRLCEAQCGFIYQIEQNAMRAVAEIGVPPAFAEYRRNNLHTGGAATPADMMRATRKPAHVHDARDSEPYRNGNPNAVAGVDLGGARTVLYVPMIRNDDIVGVINVYRQEVRPFTQEQISLLENFASQAVIAIENVRLFNDTREALEQQTATAEVLEVISSSAGDLAPVFDAMLSKAMRLCGANFGVLNTFDGDLFHTAATYGLPTAYDEYRRKQPLDYGPGTAPARLLRGEPSVEIHDLLDSDAYRKGEPNRRALVDLGRARSLLAVPLLKDEQVVGNVMIFRQEPDGFSKKQIALLKQFAAQAVIAIENARLLHELRSSTKDLSESLDQQTATSDVLKVISRSAFDLQTVLETLIRSAVQLSGALRGVIFLRDGEVFRFRAASYTDISPAWLEWLKDNPHSASKQTLVGRAIASAQTVCIPDFLTDPDLGARAPGKEIGGIRAGLAVPLLRNGQVEGVMALSRPEPGPFMTRQVELVETFADQAVIAIENARLFNEVQSRTNELAASLDDLRAAQDRLVQTEKLASLGQLTAGIAHEIKNPLNFVNNFSALSVELIDELNETLVPASLDQKMRGEVGELTQMLKSNLEKVVQHGKRADSIVKNMLLHSREGSGEQRPADINAILDESLNLAYHGARAEKPGFNITLQRDLDPSAGEIELFPQEITRAFLNLISNGFYAASKRQAENGGPDFEPVLSAVTKNLGNHVEIRIRDNGTGIPAEVKEKIFNPFFTTKPAGEGTGLGLSMSHDIIVKQHGGRIEVDTQPGQFTEFTIILPRTGNIAINREN